MVWLPDWKWNQIQAQKKGGNWQKGYGKGGAGSLMSMLGSLLGMGGKGKGKGKGKWKKGLGGHSVSKRVWIKGVPEVYDYNKLKEHLGNAGKVKYISIRKGEGGAVFESEDEAQNAVTMLNG